MGRFIFVMLFLSLTITDNILFKCDRNIILNYVHSIYSLHDMYNSHRLLTFSRYTNNFIAVSTIIVGNIYFSIVTLHNTIIMVMNNIELSFCTSGCMNYLFADLYRFPVKYLSRNWHWKEYYENHFIPIHFTVLLCSMS